MSWLRAVSYTHLMDMGMFGGTGETLVLNANHPLVQYVLGHTEDANTSKICEPVSYTHLDVYKRQLIGQNHNNDFSPGCS